MDFESTRTASFPPDHPEPGPEVAEGRRPLTMPRRLALASTQPRSDVPGHLAEPSANALLAAILLPAAILPARKPGTVPMSGSRPGTPMLGLPPAAAELALGMCRGEIALRYQPVVRLADRRPVMVEALARWHRPTVNVPPDTFFPLAERNGLARALSMVVALRAGVELGRLRDRLDIGLSINLPLAQLLQHDLVQWLHEAMRYSGLQPRHVALELTETTEVRDLSTLHRALRRLGAAGYRVLLDDIALDDERQRFFHLPFDGFKLDRSLVTMLPDDARARRQVRDLVRIADREGRQVIAEGVSDLRLWAAVRGLGIHHAQGFIVGRPLAAEALPAWWASWRSRQPA